MNLVIPAIELVQLGAAVHIELGDLVIVAVEQAQNGVASQSIDRGQLIVLTLEQLENRVGADIDRMKLVAIAPKPGQVRKS